MRLTLSEWTVLQFLKLLPKNLISMCAGFLVSIPFPQPFQKWFVKIFGNIFGVDWSEVKNELSSFKTIQSFFIRELKDGVRPISAGEKDFTSPCDGAWGQSGTIENGLILQVKGMAYSVADFVGSREIAEELEGGSYVTLYLSPKDYHRFHIPFDLTLDAIEHIPGALWPVNRIGIVGVPEIFAKNERIVAHMNLQADKIVENEKTNKLIMVPVGATNVGKIKLSFDCDKIESNRMNPQNLTKKYEPSLSFQKGDEWGHFEFGSTVIFLTPKDLIDIDFQPVGTPVRMGQKIASIRG